MKESPGVSRRAIEKQVKKLRENGKIHRVGTDKSGTWEVVENGSEHGGFGPQKWSEGLGDFELICFLVVKGE